jgi:hypothetical protein
MPIMISDKKYPTPLSFFGKKKNTN